MATDEQSQKLLCAVEQGPCAVVITDTDGNIEYTNPKFTHLTGYCQDEVLGLRLPIFHANEHANEQANEATPNEKEYKHLWSTVTSGGEWRGEFCNRKKNGELYWGYASISSVKNREGVITNFFAVMEDITSRKEEEERLRRRCHELRKALEGALKSMVSAVEKKDPYMAGHHHRVADLACAIAAELGLPADLVDGIRLAAAVHDVGKASLPAEILGKPGLLTRSELKMIRMHSEYGYEMLKDMDFPWPIAEIVLQHQERLDGSGYPAGLSGEEILLEARILGVADVVEAMDSVRAYRPALGLEKALEEISRNRGVLYDTDVVDACLRLFDEKCFRFSEVASTAAG